MPKYFSTNELSAQYDLHPITFGRILKNDGDFPRPTRIGRENYYNSAEFWQWLKKRSTNPDALLDSDKVLSKSQVLRMVQRSSGWLWLNAIKPKKLTRVNLSPNPDTNKLANYFIEREIYEEFGDLIAVKKAARGEV